MTTTPGKWKLAIYLAGIFAAGAISGWVVAEKTIKEKMYSPPKRQEVQKSLKDVCYGRLHLTPEQQKEFDVIVDENWKRIEAIRDDQMQQIRDVVGIRNARIMKILTPEQQTEFEAIEKERRESRNKGSRGRKENKATNDAPTKPRACCDKEKTKLRS